LCHGAPRHRQVAPVGQRQVELIHQLVDPPVAVERHPQHEPDHLLSGKAPAAQGCRAGQLERLLDPVGIDARPQAVEVRLVKLRQIKSRFSIRSHLRSAASSRPQPGELLYLPRATRSP